MFSGSVNSSVCFCDFVCVVFNIFFFSYFRLAVQLEAQEAAVHSALKRLTRYLSFLDAAPPTAAWPSLWAKSDDAAAIKAAIVTIGRQVIHFFSKINE